MINLEKFSRHYFQSLTTSELYRNLKILEIFLKEQFVNNVDFNTTLTDIVDKLNKLDHNLARLEYDSDTNRNREVWGTNYQDKGANGLEIEFVSPSDVFLIWVVTTKLV